MLALTVLLGYALPTWALRSILLTAKVIFLDLAAVAVTAKRQCLRLAPASQFAGVRLA